MYIFDKVCYYCFEFIHPSVQFINLVSTIIIQIFVDYISEGLHKEYGSKGIIVQVSISNGVMVLYPDSILYNAWSSTIIRPRVDPTIVEFFF